MFASRGGEFFCDVTADSVSDTENSTTEVYEWADESSNEITDTVDEGDHCRIHVREQ